MNFISPHNYVDGGCGHSRGSYLRYIVGPHLPLIRQCDKNEILVRKHRSLVQSLEAFREVRAGLGLLSVCLVSLSNGRKLMVNLEYTR
jgi:hypothetical protein